MNDFDPNLICPLCGIRPALNDGKRKYISREHIPPECIFLKPCERITVPACSECNSGTSKIDEEFKALLGIYFDYNNEEYWNKSLKTIHHQTKKELKAKILNEISSVLTRVDGGAWGYKIQVDGEPLKIVVKKIVRGFYWHITKSILPHDIFLDVCLIKQFDSLDDEIIGIFKNYGASINIGNGQFEVLYAIVTDNKYASMWLLRFYNKDCFFVTIDPR